MCHAQELAPLIRSVQEAEHHQPTPFGEIGFLFKIVLLLIFMNGCRAASAFASCDAPANLIHEENCVSGNPSSQWYVAGAGARNVQGFGTDISVNGGQTELFTCSPMAAASTSNGH